jgi:hypothetical protein
MVLLATPMPRAKPEEGFYVGLLLSVLFVKQTQFDGFDGRLGAIRDLKL